MVSIEPAAAHSADPIEQAVVFLAALAARAPSPGIEAAGADAVEAAQQRHRVVFLASNEGEDVPFRSEVNAIAFFKRSCSSLSCS